MRLFARWLATFALAFSNLNCSVNILENFADKTTDDAYFVEAQKAINEGNYQSALDTIALTSSAFQSERKVVNLKVSAYGGLCGFNFLSFAESLQGMSGRLFPFLLGAFVGGTTTKADYCVQAEDLLESLGASSARTNDENVMMMVLGFAKVGTILNYYADTNDDGTADAAYDVCAAAVGTDISDTYAREIGTGITLAADALSALAGKVNLGSSIATTLTNVCSQLPPGYDFCAKTDPTSFTANEVKGIRSLLKEDSAVGLGANCSGDLTACNCP